MSWLGEWGWNRRTRWWRTGRARRSGDPEQVRDCSSKRWWCETSSPTPASSESGLSTRLGFFPPVWMQRKIEWKVFDKKKNQNFIEFWNIFGLFCLFGTIRAFQQWLDRMGVGKAMWLMQCCLYSESEQSRWYFFFSSLDLSFLGAFVY